MSHEFDESTPKTPLYLHNIVQQADLLKGMGFRFQMPIVEMKPSVDENKDPAMVSLRSFLHHANTSQLPSKLIEELETGQELKQQLIVSSPIRGINRSTYIDQSTSSMFPDGDYSFAIGVREPGDCSLWVAAISFTSHSRLGLTRSGKRPHQHLLCPKTSPVIVQLQACYQTGPDHQQRLKTARELMKKFRWEFILSSLVIDWAREAKIPAVYILPSSMNGYAKSRPDRLKRRYDVTAQRLGFRKNEAGLFMLPLPYD